MKYLRALILGLVLVLGADAEAWQIQSGAVGGKYYFELTLGANSGGQDATSTYFLGFSTPNSNNNRVQGILDAEAVVAHPGGTALNSCGLGIATGQPGYTLGHVLGVAVDTTINGNGFSILDRTVTPGAWTPSLGFSLGCLAPGNLSIVFGGTGYRLDGAGGQDVITLNAGATSFAGTVPTGFSAWDISGGTGWGTGGSIAKLATTGGSGTTTLSASAAGLIATVATTGSTDANNWFVTPWAPDSYLASGSAGNCDGVSDIYYTFSRNGGLNGPCKNNSWYSASVAIASSTSKPHAGITGIHWVSKGWPDASSSAVTSITVPYTADGGTNSILLVSFIGDNAASIDDITSVTYGGASLTLAGKLHSGTVWIYTYYLLNETRGTANLIINSAAPHLLGLTSELEYVGVKQSGQPDAINVQTFTAASSATFSITTATDKTWSNIYALLTTGTSCCSGPSVFTAGSGFAVRNQIHYGVSGDSGAALTPAGAHTSVINSTVSAGWAGIMLSLAPK